MASLIPFTHPDPLIGARTTSITLHSLADHSAQPHDERVDLRNDNRIPTKCRRGSVYRLGKFMF
jgi:hypothetical protein